MDFSYYVLFMKLIEVDKIINPIQASDGAGVKLKKKYWC